MTKQLQCHPSWCHPSLSAICSLSPFSSPSCHHGVTTHSSGESFPCRVGHHTHFCGWFEKQHKTKFKNKTTKAKIPPPQGVPRSWPRDGEGTPGCWQTVPQWSSMRVYFKHGQQRIFNFFLLKAICQIQKQFWSEEQCYFLVYPGRILHRNTHRSLDKVLLLVPHHERKTWVWTLKC